MFFFFSSHPYKAGWLVTLSAKWYGNTNRWLAAAAVAAVAVVCLLICPFLLIAVVWTLKKSHTSPASQQFLKGLRNFLNMDRPEHHSTDRLKERGVEKGSGRHSTLQGRERSVFNQANIDTVSKATLGRLLRDGAERVWAFPSATMPS